MPHYHAYYETYTEEQFAADEYFQLWVLSEDRRNNHFWNNFLERYPSKFDTVLSARRLVKELAGNPYSIDPLTGQEKSQLKESIYERLGIQELPVVQSVPLVKRILKFRILIAAAVVMAVGAGVYLLIPARLEKSVILVEHSGMKEIKEVILPDSSVVVLNANSTLRFSSHFLKDTVRVVYLEGNAYFNVRKMPGQVPFIVHADELSIRVTGTEFNVNARTKATDIVLTSGKVDVILKDDIGQGASMTAGERLKLDTVQRKLVSTTVNTDLYTTAWKNKEWHFQETTLDSIAELIREYYGMEMVFTGNRQKKLMITAIVSVNDFSTLVNVIAKTLNIKIKEERNQLIIY